MSDSTGDLQPIGVNSDQEQVASNEMSLEDARKLLQRVSTTDMTLLDSEESLARLGNLSQAAIVMSRKLLGESIQRGNVELISTHDINALWRENDQTEHRMEFIVGGDGLLTEDVSKAAPYRLIFTTELGNTPKPKRIFGFELNLQTMELYLSEGRNAPDVVTELALPGEVFREADHYPYRPKRPYKPSDIPASADGRIGDKKVQDAEVYPIIGDGAKQMAKLLLGWENSFNVPSVGTPNLPSLPPAQK